MSAILPLTVEEQNMAEQYLYLVDKFLSRKKLDPDEYYDVAIFGYLQAIQRECRNPNPPEEKNFFGLVEVCMRRAVQMEWRKQGRIMRRGDMTSLSMDSVSAETESGEGSLYELVAAAGQDVQAQVEAGDLTQRVLAVATPREREMIDLVCLGYESREIAEILGIAVDTVYVTLNHFRVKARAVRDDSEVVKCPQWERNKEKLKAKNKAYREAHKEELAAKEKARRMAHREEINAKKRAYHQEHREEINARKRAAAAAKRAEKQAVQQEKSRPQCRKHQGQQAVALSL